ncbi:MAG: DUF3488 and transglutaminase-like domain-containing protein [Actinomycetia bacterium]|nr:DUF3488 and transglutaminase-like domain-containing protein [Actinomycetes bacterium]
MRRARVLEGLLALLAVIAVFAPLRRLITPDDWIPASLIMLVSVTVSGMILRALTRRDTVVVLGQLLIGLVLLVLIWGRGTLWHGLPTWQTILEFNRLLYEARMVITTYAPPAPSTDGMILALAMITWLSLWLVDFLAVTRGAPTLAGVPLVVAFLVPASNSGAGMPAWYFVVAAVLWLALVARSGVLSLSRWGSLTRRELRSSAPLGESTSPLARSAQLVTIAAIAVATVAAMLLPHLPTRFLLDGLGRAPAAAGGGAMSLSSSVDLTQSLESQSTAPVLRYSTTSSTPTPLRVGILDVYQGGQWGASAVNPAFENNELAAVPASDNEPETIEVTANSLAAPQLALPFPTTSLTIDSRWQALPDGAVMIERRVETYTAQYLQLTPDEEILREAVPGAQEPAYLTVDPFSSPMVQELGAEIIEPEMTPMEKARAIQAHLRGPDYTYSLELAGPQVDDQGNRIPLDPISHFLLTRQGYCTQFTAAMVMLARSEGIPARFAVGFLPGSPSAEGERTVVVADAHAWPELYFEDLGWLRFEPTPATRTAGTAPAYSGPAGAQTPLEPEPEPTTATSTATTAPQVPPQELPEYSEPVPGGSAQPATAVERVSGWLLPVGATVLALLALASAMPLSGWLERRRRRRRAVDDAERVETIWQDLLERLDDVGVTPPNDATPRRTLGYIDDHTYLTTDSRKALGRVVTAVEQARYAPPTDGDSDRVRTLERDAHTVSSHVVGSLQRKERLRSTWWPAAGVAAWKRRAGRWTRQSR